MTFVLYELAKHEDIQNKLSNEIEKIMDEDKELSYESLQKMTYLEQIISGKKELMKLYIFKQLRGMFGILKIIHLYYLF